MNNFLDLVKRMRDAQRAYFKTRTVQALEESKALEREVDEYIKKETDAQLWLFDENTNQ